MDPKYEPCQCLNPNYRPPEGREKHCAMKRKHNLPIVCGLWKQLQEYLGLARDVIEDEPDHLDALACRNYLREAIVIMEARYDDLRIPTLIEDVDSLMISMRGDLEVPDLPMSRLKIQHIYERLKSIRAAEEQYEKSIYYRHHANGIAIAIYLDDSLMNVSIMVIDESLMDE